MGCFFLVNIVVKLCPCLSDIQCTSLGLGFLGGGLFVVVVVVHKEFHVKIIFSERMCENC